MWLSWRMWIRRRTWRAARSWVWNCRRRHRHQAFPRSLTGLRSLRPRRACVAEDAPGACSLPAEVREQLQEEASYLAESTFSVLKAWLLGGLLFVRARTLGLPPCGRSLPGCLQKCGSNFRKRLRTSRTQRFRKLESITFILDSIRVSEHPCRNHNNVRVPTAYGSQSIHAQTIITFVLQEHAITRASMPKP